MADAEAWDPLAEPPTPDWARYHLGRGQDALDNPDPNVLSLMKAQAELLASIATTAYELSALLKAELEIRNPAAVVSADEVPAHRSETMVDDQKFPWAH